MTQDYAVRVQQRGPARICRFFKDNPEAVRGTVEMGLISYNTEVALPHDDPFPFLHPFAYFCLNNDERLVSRLAEALRNHTEPIREEVPHTGCVGGVLWGQVVLVGIESALVISIDGESGAYVGSSSGLFVNKPFFRTLERFVLEEGVIDEKDEYHWLAIATLRKGAGELSLRAPRRDINSAADLAKALKKWPPGAFDGPPPGDVDLRRDVDPRYYLHGPPDTRDDDVGEGGDANQVLER